MEQWLKYLQWSPQRSWTLSLFSKWRPYLTLPSLIRMRRHAIRDDKGEITRSDTMTLSFRKPLRVHFQVRELGSDLATMREVFLEEIYRTVVDSLPECNTIVDLGANIGLAALYFGAHYKNATLICIEPHPSTFTILERNVRAMVRQGRCHTLPCAIWRSEGEIVFEEPAGAKYDMVVTSEEKTDGRSSVASITMHTVIQKYGLDTIDLLKVDIEGAEAELFQCDTSWLQRVKAIAIEFHGDSRTQSGFDRLMDENGFHIVNSNRHTVLAAR